VYQANICRILSAELPDPGACDVSGLHELLTSGNPAPYSGFLRLPEHGVHLVSASPELFLSIARGADGRFARSGPIKGTGATEADLSDKDVAENIMIVDLVRNDLSRVSAPGSVNVPDLLQVQQHPGLVHLVSYVTSELVDHTSWSAIVQATFPPGSVTGAPKSSALRIIDALETESRAYYCGAFGWVDADTGEAELAVTIRTFWLDGQVLKFGTGAGITWGSNAHAEWRETELKAARLIGLAGASWPSITAMEG
jgi:para-aminobenzoate synthetase component 1